MQRSRPRGTHPRGSNPESRQEQPRPMRSTRLPRAHSDSGPAGEDLHYKCCCDLFLEETMAHVSGERAPAFTAEELEKLVDGVLRQYTLLYGPPDKQVSAHQKKGIWRAHRQGGANPGIFDRRSTHCRKQLEDLRRWVKKTVEAQLELASQQGRGARRTMSPLMFCILAVAYLELDGCLKASQQPQGGEYSF
ncbi:hypothetical protein NDU88_002672 [Pleurodeles waltl]|uniref:Uncharacterized protein n=1 Tax=Pleurodeles waltl TaxID=8319 RepID=A0AAV7NEE3_PLEWA|nr:hypothetical protein NDU88_002672 [Pleurodeles waltl]